MDPLENLLTFTVFIEITSYVVLPYRLQRKETPIKVRIDIQELMCVLQDLIEKGETDG